MDSLPRLANLDLCARVALEQVSDILARTLRIPESSGADHPSRRQLPGCRDVVQGWGCHSKNSREMRGQHLLIARTSLHDGPIHIHTLHFPPPILGTLCSPLINQLVNHIHILFHRLERALGTPEIA